MTEYQAKIFFGNEDPIGKTFSAKYAYENETITYEVAAVIKEYPQSFLKFNALAGTTSQFNGGPTLLLVNDLFNIDKMCIRDRSYLTTTFTVSSPTVTRTIPAGTAIVASSEVITVSANGIPNKLRT